MNDAGWTVDQGGAEPLRGAMLLQPGRTGAADQRNLGDSEGQQGTTNLEVSDRMAAMYLECETAGLGFHTAEPMWFCIKLIPNKRQTTTVDLAAKKSCD